MKKSNSLDTIINLLKPDFRDNNKNGWSLYLNIINKRSYLWLKSNILFIESQ